MTAPLRTAEIDITIDPVTGDIPAQGDLAMTKGVEAVVQGARIRMQMFAGEWFLNLAMGVAYIARSGVPIERVLLGQKFDRNKAIREFRGVLLGDAARGILPLPGILSVTTLNVTFEPSTRIVTITWKASTQFGDTPLDTLVTGV